MFQDVLILSLVALVGCAAPLMFQRSDRALHLLVAVATGFFLGVVFLDLLPEVAELAAEASVERPADSPGLDPHGHAAHPDVEHGHVHDGHDAHDSGELAAGVSYGRLHAHAHTHSHLWLCVLIGVVGLFVLQNVIFKSGGHVHHGAELAHAHHHGEGHTAERARLHSDRQRHVTLGYASLVGLAVHSFTAGLGLAAAKARPDIAEPLFFSIISHKATESFSLTTVFLLAGFRVRKIFGLGLLFALTTPAGLVLGSWAMDDVEQGALAVLVALAAGTFLYVAIGDLLPEVFHNRVDAVARVLLVATGVVVSMLLHGMGS